MKEIEVSAKLLGRAPYRWKKQPGRDRAPEPACRPAADRLPRQPAAPKPREWTEGLGSERHDCTRLAIPRSEGKLHNPARKCLNEMTSAGRLTQR